MMDSQDKKSSKLDAAKNMAFSVLVPFYSVRKTLELAKTEVQRSKANFHYLKQLGAEARETLRINGKKAPKRNDSFEAALKINSKKALNREALYRHFLRKKRLALGIALCFLFFSLVALLGGIFQGDWHGIILGLLSMIASQPLFFIMALGTQLRLWQLRMCRLSEQEKGGLQDYRKEVKDWWRETLDPEFNRQPLEAVR